MGIERWGRVLYMVVRSPIRCTNCGTKIDDWKKDEQGYIECPYCEQITEQNYISCPCGEDDWMRLRVVQNNNWGVDNDGHVTMLNDKIGFGVNICKKELQKQINQSKIALLSAHDSVDKKRMIQWTSSDDYDPTVPMPQWIIDKWKYEDQK